MSLQRISLRVAVLSDLDSMAKLYMDAYGYRGDVETVKRGLEVCLEVQPDGCILAILDDRVVGMGCVFIYGETAWIGGMAVEPELQRRGIGSRILEKLLEIAERYGVEVVRLDATDAGYRLYRKFGFVDEYPTVTYDISKARINIDVSGVEIVDYIPRDVASRDRQVFGGDRVRVFEAWIKRGSKLLVYRDSYALIYGKRIGPIIAFDRDAALKLLAKAISLGIEIATIPTANLGAVELVESIGGIPKYRCMRMRRGAIPREKVEYIYAILNYAKG